MAAAAIAWGTPSISYSSLYDSTATAKNTAAARMLAGAKAGKGVYEDTGVALVDKDGKDTVLYAALKGFATQANTWLEAQIEVRLRLFTCILCDCHVCMLMIQYGVAIQILELCSVSPAHAMLPSQPPAIATAYFNQ